MSETRAIQGWLTARRPADESSASPPIIPLHAPVPSKDDAETHISELDGRHKTVLRQLLQRPSGTLAELRQLTSQFGLMPLACLATLNEWAIEKFGDLLLEGEEIINVNTEIKQRIKT